MSEALSILEQRGIRLEPEGCIVLDRGQIAPQAIDSGSERADHAVYHVANPTLSATFENPGQVVNYEVTGVGPILEPGAWRLTLNLDGLPSAVYPPLTRACGHWLSETWSAPGCRLTVTSFCPEERNAVYQAYRLESLDEREHSLEASLRTGFLADEDQAGYSLRYDERHGAIVALLGETPFQFAGQPALLPARAALLGANLPPVEWRVSDQRAYLTYRLSVPGRQEQTFCIVITGGRDRSEQESLFEQAIRRWPQALARARRYSDWLGSRVELDDPALHSLFVSGLNCALSAYREGDRDRSAALVRSASEPDDGFTFPCDAYWCAQALLPFYPEKVRAEILTLARSVDDQGRLPLAVPTGMAVPEDAAREPTQHATRNTQYGIRTTQYASDSPSYFAMLVHDYLAWTGERELLDEQVGAHTIWQKTWTCVDYLRRCDTDRDYLFEKRRDQPDWAFDVLRDGWVTYDLALHYQALKCVAEMALLRGNEEAARDLADWSAGAQRAINKLLWDEGRGCYVDYHHSDSGSVEDHVAVDTVLAALFGLATEHMVHRQLDCLARALETQHNPAQYYGDWGVMSCFPFHQDRARLAGRSASAYSYHNGGAWPGWSGVLALAMLLHRHGDWRYVLERWWSYGLEQYWFTPTEWYAPPYDAPALRCSAPLHAWGSVAAAAMILGGFGFWPDLAGNVVLRVPPWGDSRLNGVRFRGETYDVQAHDSAVTVYRNGGAIASDRHGLRLRLGAVPVQP